MEYELPPILGKTWKDFTEHWHVRGALGYSKECALIALDTLHRLWPTELSRIVHDSARGVAVIVPAIDIGLILADCEKLDGFQSVVARLKAGERGAYSELLLGSTLLSLGFESTLEAPLQGKVLDAQCDVEGVPVYFEVVSPDSPDHSVDLQNQVEDLTNAIRNVVSRCRVEVALSAPLTAKTIDAICKSVRSAASNVWLKVNDSARVRRIDVGEPLRSTFNGEGTQVIFSGEREHQGSGTNLIIRWEDNDERTKRLFNREYSHFSDSAANVLVVNTCAIPGGFNSWTECMARILRPDQNRKVGAVVLFDQGVLGPPEAIRRRWKVIRNEHSHLAIPNSLLDGFKSLDESPVFLGKQSPAMKHAVM